MKVSFLFIRILVNSTKFNLHTSVFSENTLIMCAQQEHIQNGEQFSVLLSCLLCVCSVLLLLCLIQSSSSMHGERESTKMYTLNMTVKNFTFAKMLKIMNNFILALMQIFDVKAKMLLFNINY